MYRRTCTCASSNHFIIEDFNSYVKSVRLLSPTQRHITAMILELKQVDLHYLHRIVHRMHIMNIAIQKTIQTKD